MKLYSPEALNKERQKELDIAKAIAIIGMVLIHVLEYIYPDAEPEFTTGYGIFVNMIWGGLFAAPLFMFCMGFTQNYTRNNAPGFLLKRGVVLFIVAHILNIVRDVIPDIIMGAIGLGDEFYEYAIEAFSYVDILQFAGLAFLLLGLLKKMKINDGWILAIAAVLAGGSSFVHDCEIESDALNKVVGYFVGMESCEISYFPLCNWFIIVVLGLMAGKFMIHCIDRKKLYLIVAPVSWILTAAYMVIGLNSDSSFFSNDYGEYHMYIHDAIFCSVAAVAVISLAGLVVDYLPKFIVNTAVFMSSHINTIYLISWLIITWVVNMLLVNILGVEFNLLTGSLLAIPVLLLSVWLSGKIKLKF